MATSSAGDSVYAFSVTEQKLEHAKLCARRTTAVTPTTKETLKHTLDAYRGRSNTHGANFYYRHLLTLGHIAFMALIT